MAFVIKTQGFDAEAKKLYNKTFSDIPDTAASDASAQAKFVNRYTALTTAVTATAQKVVTTDIDLA